MVVKQSVEPSTTTAVVVDHVVVSSSEPSDSSDASCASVSSQSSRCTGGTMLPEDFSPSPHSVVCGRGRQCAQAIGNRRLAVIASTFLSRYAKATRKEEKTLIVTEIIQMVRKACDDDRHAFIRFHEGRWWQVGSLNAREKVGTVLRDALHSKYRSSTKSKLARRKERREAKKRHSQTIINMDPFNLANIVSLEMDMEAISSDDSSVLSGVELDQLGMDQLFD